MTLETNEQKKGNQNQLSNNQKPPDQSIQAHELSDGIEKKAKDHVKIGFDNPRLRQAALQLAYFSEFYIHKYKSKYISLWQRLIFEKTEEIMINKSNVNELSRLKQKQKETEFFQ